jgi:hypothetical protein
VDGEAGVTIYRAPKPEKRARKPPRRIPRVRARGKREQPAALLGYRKWMKEADRLWSLIIRSYSPLCVRCKTRPTHDAMHWVSRRYHQTRHDLANGSPGCRYCHKLMGEDAHEHARVACLTIGLPTWEALNQRKNMKAKIDMRLRAIALEAHARSRGLLPEVKP